MKAVIQRVKRARVLVDGNEIGATEQGLLVLLGVMDGDTAETARLLAGKTARLRIFEDEQGKMNKSVNDVGGGVLTVSQFTLCADTKKGNRPSFTPSAKPDEAKALYELYSACLAEEGVAHTANGEFGADMQVELVNDGPVTIILDTDVWEKK